ncbi:MAG: hypothetical protein PHP45_06820 [Elusimicrobiales bacterium]|nr:hypothetical protein [Elusimicrobiales bacterium]
MTRFGEIGNIPPGAVFLANGSSSFSRLVRAISLRNFPRDHYTHAGIYLGGRRRLIAHELYGPGATIQPLEEELASDSLVSVWAPPAPLVDVLRVCYENNAPYSLTASLMRALGWPVPAKAGLICTEFVLRAYRSAGAPLMCDRVAGVLPNELRDALESAANWKLVFRQEK